MYFRLLYKLRIQKIISYWFFLSFLLAPFFSPAQQVNISVKDAPVESVFSKIKKQTGYGFVFTSEEIKKARLVSVTLHNAALKDALEMIFKEQPLSFTIEDNFIVVRGRIEQMQMTEIRGKVVDEKGEGIAGVSIKIKNSGEGTATSVDGTFEIKTINENPVLVFSSIGFEPKEITAVNGHYLLVELKTSVGKLDETMVIAYGTTTRRLSTGSVSKLKSEDISKQPVSNMLLALEGRISGLQVTQNSGVPGGNVTVLLRGRNSLANGNDPLYIIDGVPFTSTSLSSGYGGGAGVVASPFDNLNPLDIESIEVLKDADATAIYGSKAANGVIIITTKKSNGAYTKAEVNFYQGFGKATRLMSLLGTPDYLQMRREAFKNDGTVPTLANAKDLLLWDTTRYTDWQKVLIDHNAAITDLYASASGGSGSTQFLIAGGYHRENTVFSSQFGESKISAHYSFSHSSMNKKFKIYFQGNYSYNDNLLPQIDLTSFINLPPDAPRLYDSVGNLNWENATWTNPLSYFEKKYRTTTENFITDLILEWQISKKLQYKTSFGYTNIQMNELITTPLKSYNPAFASTAMAYTGFGNNAIKTLIIEPQFNYQSKLGKRGILQLLIGGTFQQSNQITLLQTGYGFTSDALIENIKAAASVSIDNNNLVRYKYLGIFSRLNYDLDSKYIFSLTARRDGSSRFGPENRFANFGSAGLSWIFSSEKFLSASKNWLSFGKLKGSWGITGNDQIGDYKYLDTYTAYSYPYQGASTLYPTQLFNPLYGWERVRKTELGIDLGFLKDRILLNADYYYNITSNQLVQYPLPTLSGFSGILKNIPARIENNGIELDLNIVLKKTKQLEWSSSFTMTIPKNKLLSYPGLESSSYATTYVVGKSLFIAKRYHFLGVDPTSGVYLFKDYNNDGKISSVDQQSVLFTGQQYFGGFQNNMKYKNWQFSFFLQFVRQKNVPDYLSRFTSKPGSLSNQPALVDGRWQKAGDVSGIQKFSNSNSFTNSGFSNLRFSDGAFSDGSFLRLKNVFASYDFSVKKMRKTGISGVKLFAQAQDILTITNYAGLDPESRSVLPPLKVITAGLQIIFQ